MIRSSSAFALGLAALLGSSSLLPARTPETVPVASPADQVARFLHPGDLAPPFTVTDATGATVKLSDFRGQILIVDVSATWCGPCQAAMPNNDRIYRKYADKGVVLIGVTADDTQANYLGWVQRNAPKYEFKMMFDPAGRDGWKDSVFNTAYHITGFPTMFVIDRAGKISEILSGGGPGEDYRLEYALARAGVKVDLASIPPEPKPDPNAPKAVPMATKTLAMPMMGMGGAPSAQFVPGRFGSITAGSIVPDFSLTGADGQPVKLTDFRGKPLFVHFCTGNGPQPWVLQMAAEYRAQGLQTLLVFAAAERADFERWVKAHPAPGVTVAWDPAGRAWAENVTNTIFGVGMYPATVVVDPNGRLVSGAIGMGGMVNGMTAAMLERTGIKLSAADAAVLAKERGAKSMAAALIKPHPAAPGDNAPKIPTLGAGAVAPDFVSDTVDGKAVKLADFAGKVVILDFWATWCGPCMASMPHTQELAKIYGDQGVVVLASCTSDTRAMFEQWVKKNQARYPDLRFTTDPNERGSATFEDRASAKLYHVVGIPTQFIIGRDGKIAGTIVGYDEGDARAAAVLARAGIKVDPALVTEGEKQLKRDADNAIKEAAAAKALASNPRPPFEERFGKIAAGQTVPDFTVQTADGKTAKFSDFAKGKTVILDFWATWCGPCQMAMPHLEEAYQRYQDQNVVVVGLCCFDTREAYDAWLKKNAGKYTFPTVFDPVGRPKLPSPDDMAKMTPEEKAAAKARTKQYYDAVIASGVFGAFPMLPTTLVINHEGKLLGAYAGYREGKNEALGNLLLRAGVNLAAADQPAKVWTAAETKEAPPEARVALLKLGATAPDFAAQDLAGKDVRLSDFKGKVVILDFWATWCGPCMAAMPHTEEVAGRYRDQGVVVLGSCTSDTRAKFESWVKANQEKYPDIVWTHDAAGREPGRVSHRLYGVNGIPTQFVIGRDGKVVDIVIGYKNGEAILDGALAKAGIKVDPALVAKAARDLAARE